MNHFEYTPYNTALTQVKKDVEIYQHVKDAYDTFSDQFDDEAGRLAFVMEVNSVLCNAHKLFGSETLTPETIADMLGDNPDMRPKHFDRYANIYPAVRQLTDGIVELNVYLRKHNKETNRRFIDIESDPQNYDPLQPFIDIATRIYEK